MWYGENSDQHVPSFPCWSRTQLETLRKKIKTIYPHRRNLFSAYFLRSNSKTRRTTLTKIVSQSKHTNTFYAFTREWFELWWVPESLVFRGPTGSPVWRIAKNTVLVVFLISTKFTNYTTLKTKLNTEGGAVMGLPCSWCSSAFAGRRCAANVRCIPSCWRFLSSLFSNTYS